MKHPALLLVLLATPVLAQVRREIAVPDLPGYQTLVCDFHMHSVFSDGTVWPTVLSTGTSSIARLSQLGQEIDDFRHVRAPRTLVAAMVGLENRL